MRDAWSAIPLRHFVIAGVLGLVWGLANALGFTIGHATGDVAQSVVHFVYQSLVPMLLLVFGIGLADAASRDDPNAIAPYAAAAVGAAIVGEIMFEATAPWLGLGSCGCNMDRWPAGARVANMLPDSLLICGFITAGYRYRRRTSMRLARLRARELERAQVTRRTVESRLQAMQACIEPQFLFDTLAAVERLHASEPRTAARLIDELIIYLRAALPNLRESSSTVAKETGLVHAWLNIQRLRHRHGPALVIDVAAEVEGAPLPPMLLLPLADYLLGDLATAAPDAELRLTIRREGDHLRVVLAAQGAAGPAAANGADKLAGMRTRLFTLYGDAATLALGTDPRDATLLTLTIPDDETDRHHR